ncbi:aldo/keto reductase [Candidatus Poriferisodalis sp.]|uniref:aldo/keto reductase n=1 Tax=Candidatus Poriferisodalis sp. TaxID=3101277 RepID=UPI003D13B82E
MADLVTRTQAAPVVLGAIAFGKPSETTRDHPLAADDSCSDLLRAFAALGGEELDTSRMYQNGNSEAVIGRLLAGAGIRVGTKYHPSVDGGPVAQMEQSLMALRRDSVSIYYIHMPSTEIPLEDTLAEINDCHAAGQFERFGLSNFPAWQVVEIAQYCQRHRYVMPTVYQGVYNALNRTAEYELIPVLRNYGISYYTHGSLASGFLTGKYRKGVAPVKGVDRFAQSRRIRQYEERYLHRDEMFAALDAITAAASEAELSTLEAAVRWTQHHSAVDASLGDAVLVGVSRIEQLAPIMRASRGGPLPDALVEAFDVANECVKMKSEYYMQYPYPTEGSPWRSRF